MSTLAQQLAEALAELYSAACSIDDQSIRLQSALTDAHTALAACDEQEAEPSEYPEGTHVWTVENPDFRAIPGGLQAVTFTPKVGFWAESDNRKDGAFFWVRLSRDGTELCLPSESVTTTQPGEKA